MNGNGASGFGRRGSDLTGTQAGLSDAARHFRDQERNGSASSRESEIEFKIGGSDIQYVEIELDPGEAVVTEHGTMIWKDSDIELSVRLGDAADDNAGMLSKAGSAARNAVAGESLMLTQLTHTGHGRKAKLALGGRSIGHIAPVRLDAVGGALITRCGAMLAMAKGIRLEAQWNRRLSAGLLGEEGLIMQGLTGSGWVFLHVGGTLIEKELAAGEMISVDSGCLVAHQPSVDVGVGFTGGLGAQIVGGEGMLLSTLRGPGKVWIQTMPEGLALALDGKNTARAGAVAGALGGAAEGVAEGLLRKFF